MIDAEFSDAVFTDIDVVKANIGIGGATLHAATMSYDDGSGITYLVTGPGIPVAEYKSAGAAYASYRARRNSHSIWRITLDGKRKLVLR